MYAPLEIVAHRGAPDSAPENTLPAFLHALELGADAVELDVRLTADLVPVVFHYFYLDEITSLAGPIFLYTWKELRQTDVFLPAKSEIANTSISSLEEVLDTLAGQIGLEVEIKGPERASAAIIAATLKNHPQALQNLEITSYEPLLLTQIQQLLPETPTDLLIPLTEPWMKADVLAYTALQRGKLAGARAVHLHTSQLLADTVEFIRQGGCEVHAWGVNDRQALETASELCIGKICTDNLSLALKYRLALNQQQEF